MNKRPMSIQFHSQDYRFKSLRYVYELLEFLYKQSLENSEFCDITLHIQDTTIKAHWYILMMCPYFHSLHKSRMKEYASNEVHLAVGAVYAVKKAIRFLYTGQLTMNLETVGDLLEVADYLQISEMRYGCAHYIRGTIVTDENCVQLLLLGSRYNLDIYDRALEYMCARLPQFLKGDDLLEFAQTSVLSLVSDVTLSYVPRGDFFNFIVRWTEHDKENREKEFEGLFCALQLSLIPTDMFSTVENHPLALESKKCREHCQLTKQMNLEKANSGCAHTQDVIILAEKIYYSNIYIIFLDEERWTKLKLFEILDPARKPVLAIAEDRIMCVDKFVDQEEYRLFSYFPGEKKCTELSLNWSEGPTGDLDIHAMFACGHRLFLVATKKCNSLKKADISGSGEHQTDNDDFETEQWSVQIMELQKDSGDLHFKCELFRHCDDCKIQAVCQQTTKGITLDGGFICVMSVSLSGLNSEETSQKKGTKFVIYNIQSNSVDEVGLFADKFGHQPLVFGLTKGFLALDCSTGICHMFGQTHEKLVYKLQPFPAYSNLEDCSFISLNHDVYIFGGRLESSEEATDAARFSLAEQKWTDLPPSPGPVTITAIARGRLALDVLRCHWLCPHCNIEPDAYPMNDTDDSYENDESSVQSNYWYLRGPYNASSDEDR